MEISDTLRANWRREANDTFRSEGRRQQPGEKKDCCGRSTRAVYLAQRLSRADSGRSPGPLLHSLDFGPRLDDGEEFRGILFRADFYVAEAIDEPLDEGPLPDGVLRHARQAG